MTEAIIEDFEQILGIGDGDGIAHPVVEDQQAGSGQRAQEVGEGAILVGESESMQQAGSAQVAHGGSGAGGGCPKRTSHERLPRAGGSKDDQVVVAGDPGTLGQLEHLAAFEAAAGGKVELFEGSLHRETGGVDAATNTVLPTLGALVVHEQSQALFEGELGVFGIFLLLSESLAEGRQAQLEQLVIEGR